MILEIIASDHIFVFLFFPHGFTNICNVLKVFQGNSNRNTTVRQNVSPVIIARYIRLHPKTWHGHISMRAEFIGCFEGNLF